MKNYTKTMINRAWFSRLLRQETEWLYFYNPGDCTGQHIDRVTNAFTHHRQND